MKKNKGITLIALVITVIVLLIIAGVSIASLTGENGLIRKAKDAKSESAIADIKEEIERKVLNYMAENGGDITEDEFKDILRQYDPNIDKTYPKITIGNKKIKVSNLYDDGFAPPPPKIADGSWSNEKGVNTPILKDGMQLVKYDESKKDWVVDSTNSEYSYVKGTGSEDNNKSKWANGRLNGNYYVWIPRYSYKIDESVTYKTQPDRYGDPGTSHKIDVKFVDTNTKGTDSEGYLVHPAFTFGTEELPGIWVGKYETSGTVDKPTIIPNVTSLRNINVKTMFNTAQKLKTTNYDTHMMKNMEWGCVAYLAQSPYGRNGTEISVNECSDYITGAGKGSGTNRIYEDKPYSQSVMTAEQKYNGEIGQLSSTTGNVYGIYDTAGGAWDTVMGIVGTGNPIKPILGATRFTEAEFASINSKYYDIYTNPTDLYSDATGGKIGDATKETKEWNSDYAYFPYSSSPVFYRGGNYDKDYLAGGFYFISDTGGAVRFYGFRVVL